MMLEIFKDVRGVLFDYDGTLVDTMNLHYEAWSVVLKKRNIYVSRNRFFELEGTNIYSLMQTLTGIKNDFVVNDLIKEKDSYFIERYSFSPFPEVETLLKFFLEKK